MGEFTFVVFRAERVNFILRLRMYKLSLLSLSLWSAAAAKRKMVFAIQPVQLDYFGEGRVFCIHIAYRGPFGEP